MTKVRSAVESKEWGREMHQRLAHALSLQRKGLTLTEIAQAMRVPREAVVEALYYDQVSK